MTNDELLAGFLDRSLNEDQLIEFEARKKAQPEFAQEVNEMLVVENLLAESAPVANIPADFLASVEHAVAAKVSAGYSVGGLLTSLATNVWTWIAGAAVIAAGGYYVFISGRPEPQNDSSSQRITRIVKPAFVPDANVDVVPNSNLKSMPSNSPGVSTNMPQRTAKQNAGRKAATETVPNHTIGGKGQGIDMLTVNSDRALNGLLKDLEKCRAASDHVLCSHIALTIGRTYSKQNAFEPAEKYLNIALIEAKTARLVQFEIEANGELAVVAQSDGRINEAKQLYRKAVNLGVVNGIQVDKWSKALEALDN